jgi:hypothetical protein
VNPDPGFGTLCHGSIFRQTIEEKGFPLEYMYYIYNKYDKISDSTGIALFAESDGFGGYLQAAGK